MNGRTNERTDGWFDARMRDGSYSDFHILKYEYCIVEIMVDYVISAAMTMIVIMINIRKKNIFRLNMYTISLITC